MATPRVSTAIACRIVGLNRDRLNEYIAAGQYACAPATVPGRARLFDPDDLLTLMLFKRLMGDGYTVEGAGRIACAIGNLAKVHPDARAISYVESYIGSGHAMLSHDVPAADEWDDVLLSGTDIRKVTTFRIGKERDMVAHYIDEETSTFRDPSDEIE
ncbi:MerR family transcriptional regulator [Sphingomicrobium sp. XHP0239]|uniref:MerR family transcriptional regulator n=1 Tax=Sphingomicrobium maritimum TaxID=3133972 RepID=UPI0031CCA135